MFRSCSLALLFIALLASPADAARPNIVIVLADDLGIGDATCYNPDSRIPTPHLDRVAREGVRFDDAHAPSAVCTPTRYGLLTGHYAWRTRLTSGVLWTGWDRPLIEPGRPTLASFLRANGYRTAVAGKWHLGWSWASTDGTPVTVASHDQVDYTRPVSSGPGDAGFDESFVIPASLDMPPYLWLQDDRVVAAPTGHTKGSQRRWSGGGGFWRAGPIAPGFEFDDVVPAVTEHAVAFVESCAAASRAGDEQPFFLYVPLPAPHTPWVPAAEFQGRSVVGWYGDFVMQTDWAVGRILAALDRNGLAADTLLVVTSDNGAHWPAGQIARWQHHANGPWRGQKADIWEGGHRVPFLVRWPGRAPAGSISNALIGLVDLMATVADAIDASLPPSATPDGVSILPQIRDPNRAPVSRTLVHHSLNGTFAVRRGRWKLVVDNLGSGGFTAPAKRPPAAGEPGGQLYDLETDPREQTNVWNAHPDIVAELESALSAIRSKHRQAQ
ncbi:MAG: arylsulfatase [Phycisphaerales bacterium]|nr:arylsulfatase [Phycisphaerae bacterium]NNM24778.1 arylsulfatase [Phycisphaerales bacterium]